MAAEQVQAGPITVELSHPGKLLFPDDGVSKRDLVEYYLAVADWMLPPLRRRPVFMTRYPDGITHLGIVQKNVPGYFPSWVTRARVPKQGGSVEQVICDKPATLAYLANQACIELHGFLSTLDRVDHPDQVVFDLDPPDAGRFGDVRRAALLLRALLESELGMTTFVKTTGGKGLHVHLPLDGEDGFDTAREFARRAGGVLAARHPDLLTLEQRRNKRGNRIYVDVMRNSYAQTAVAPYAVRGRPGAPVATPLDWGELDDAGLRPARFTLRTVPARLSGLGRERDPWAAFGRQRYRLADRQDALQQLLA